MGISVKTVHKPQRKVIIKRGVAAKGYFAYCNEVGCDVWEQLVKMGQDEPVCMWLPECYIKPNTSVYVQGVEVENDYSGAIPDGFDIISLPECDYLQFCGEPFAEENFGEAIDEIWKFMDGFNPTDLGYCWDEENPRIQLEPRGERGYIELKAVKKI